MWREAKDIDIESSMRSITECEKMEIASYVLFSIKALLCRTAQL